MKAIYEFEAGPHEILVLSDGHLVLPTSLLGLGAPEEERDATLSKAALTGDTYEPAANVPLIRTGSDLILFDTGGTGFQSQLGRLADNLGGAGIDPASITKVVFTHGHPDHIGGTVLEDGSLRFPNAAYYAGAAEWDFWNGEDVWAKLPDAQHPFAVGARRQYAAIKDRVTVMRPGDEIVSGIRAIATPGHTPGHLSFEIAGGEGLIIVGDVVTAPSVYFPHPDWRFGFDADHDKAIKSRTSLLARASSDRTTLLGYHWPYPGVGYARRDGTAYRYVPASSDGAAS